MVKKQLMKFFLKLIYTTIFIICTKPSYAEVNLDQWQDSEKSYKDLIEEGFEVKAYDISSIKTDSGLILMFFVTVLQKNNQVYECQEYQTFDNQMNTLNLSIVCRELSQPYKVGVDT